MLAKINKLTNWQAAFTIALVGFAVFSTGLTNQFQGDDTLQIVNNVPVHSITNLRLFFEGSTFYNGQEHAPLSGFYYRPLMTTVFSLIYTVFGPHPIYYHLVQLFLTIGSTFILYLFFKYSFKPVWALILSVAFLIYPINSQTVFLIPRMQDSLFFFFGILGLYLLIRFSSVRSLIFVAGCFFFSLLSKESGVLFIIMALLYLFWWNKKRLRAFVIIMLPTIAIWLLLKINAIGLLGQNPNSAPIDLLSFTQRMMTVPSIIQFYITKVVFPWKLADAYYWVHPTFSVRNFLLPLVVDLAVVAIILYLIIALRRKASEAHFYKFLFFTIWFAIGLLLILQIIPLDETAAEGWAYFMMAGVLGMVGVAFDGLFPKIRTDHYRLLCIIPMLLLGLFGLRTAIRGYEIGRAPQVVNRAEIAASPSDFIAEYQLANYYYLQDDYKDAKTHASQSVAIFSNQNNNYILGLSNFMLGDYSVAYKAYNDGLKYSQYVPLYDGLASLTPVYGNPESNRRYLINTLKKFPKDADVWFYLALLEYRANNTAEAKIAIKNTVFYGQNSQLASTVYYYIMNEKPFSIYVGNTNVHVR